MFSNNAYAKLWKIEQVQGKNYYQGQISTSRKITILITAISVTLP